MGASAFAAVDLGAGSGRVMLGLVTGSGVELREVHRFANEPVRVAGRLCWDVDALYAQTLAGLRELVEQARDVGATLAGIGVDSWGVDYGLLGPGGLRPGVGHHRDGVDVQRGRARRRVAPETAYRISGVLDQSINTGFRLQADLENGRARPGDTVLLVPDLWAYLLTGQIAAEATIASTTQLLDRATGDWSPVLVEGHGLGSLALPPVVRPGSLAGHTTAGVTRVLGAGAPVPVYRVAGHDTASALAVAGPPGADVALISSGSWSLVGLATARPLTTPAAAGAGFTNELGVSSSLLLRNLSGMWILQECLGRWSERDGRAPDLLALLTQAGEVTGHDAVFDALDERLLAPGDMPARVRALAHDAGRPEPTTRAEVVRAVLDSLAASYASAVDAARSLTGRGVGSVVVVGGGSRNALLCQLTADRSGLAVTTGPAEASSLGNVAVQAVAAGVVPDLTTFLARPLLGASPTTYRPGAAPARSTTKAGR